jgi:hypothetical protein
VGWVPWLVFDGKYDARQDTEDPATWLRTAFDSLLAVPSPIRINLSQLRRAAWDSVDVSFDVVAVDPLPIGPRTTGISVFLAVTEEGHRYPFPTLKWRYAFRDFVPGSVGYPVTLAQGDSLHFDWSYKVDPIYNKDQIFTNIFVQLTDTLMVWVDDPPPGHMEVVNQATMLQAASARVLDVASVPPGATQAFLWLGQNAPNPFTSDTRIAYELGQAGAVRLEVYTPTGRLVTTLVDKYLEPGPYSAAWDGRDSAGHAAGSGVYYYQLDARGMHRSGRMVLLK